MNASLLGMIGFLAANGLFALLIWRIRRIRRGWLRSAAREGLFWVTMALQVLAAMRGVAILANDGSWLGRADDIACAFGGLWLGALALGERRARRLLATPASLPAGGQRC